MNISQSTHQQTRNQQQYAKNDGMDAIDVLIMQHQEIEALFSELLETLENEGENADDIAQELIKTIEKHSEIEEKHLYPELENITEEKAMEAIEDHSAVSLQLKELKKIDSSNEKFFAKIKVLQKSLDNHIEEEEEYLFPLMEKNLNPNKLFKIGEEMQSYSLTQPNKKTKKIASKKTARSTKIKRTSQHKKKTKKKTKK